MSNWRIRLTIHHRRAKRFCDKKLPCSPCLERGFGHFCPHGENTPAIGSGISYTIDSSQNLWTKRTFERTGQIHVKKLDCLATRIRVLEDALLAESGDAHPLLAQEQCLIAPKRAATKTHRSKRPWADRRMDAGTLLVRDVSAECLYGAMAAEVSPSITTLSMSNCNGSFTP